MSGKLISILFLCTGNSARSIIAEALMNKLGAGRFQAFSAGSHPVGGVNPFAIEVLQAHGCAVDGLRSKSWDEFSGRAAPNIDFVITVCDNAAGEMCPVWTGHPVTAHWEIDDPAAVTGGDAGKRAAFATAFDEIAQRVRDFLNLPLEELSREALQKEIDAVGEPVR